MTAFHERNITRSRKPNRCKWCWAMIATGEPYQSYRWAEDGEVDTVRMHVECMTAMRVEARANGGRIEWSPGDHERPADAEPHNA